MNENANDSRERDDVEPSAESEIARRARELEESVKLSPEAARMTARDELATGAGKPASQEVDSARAAVARATEP